ncbi:MAG: hypothetical protein V8Q43_05095 [Christensenellaceae bacterium]
MTSASANMQMEKNGQPVSVGDIEHGLSGDRANRRPALRIGRLFQIQAVTEGREAMGSALRLHSSRLYSGNNISTDIVKKAKRPQ